MESVAGESYFFNWPGVIENVSGLFARQFVGLTGRWCSSPNRSAMERLPDAGQKIRAERQVSSFTRAVIDPEESHDEGNPAGRLPIVKLPVELLAWQSGSRPLQFCLCIGC